MSTDPTAIKGTIKGTIRVPIRYLPRRLTAKDRARQFRMLMKSRKLYKTGKYYTRKPVPSYQHKTSDHILRARKLYKIANIAPTPELSRKTGCSLKALRKIVNKGEGAYFSSGSRPNQTAQSWGIARLASSLTAGKSAAVDYKILESGCNHRKTAFRLANQSRKKYNYGKGHAHRTSVRIK